MTSKANNNLNWEIIIGLEVHAQVVSNSKLFSGMSTTYGGEPNTQVSYIDAAFPGMLPVINKFCIEQAVRTGLGLKAKINMESVFDRKNYFYADLPAGYQISQFENPIVGKGQVILDMPDGTIREIGITRLHLEQDAGKSIHDSNSANSYVDLNRAGIALMEIVSEPDMRSSEEAGLFLKKLRTILRYLGTCDGNMEQGSMRADVNVSVRRYGEELGTRCEIKNVNSIRFVQQAIEYESKRQIKEIELGNKIVQETRLFDPKNFETRPMRSKEESHDYRYFPDPDLLPLKLSQTWIDQISKSLPELPDDRKQRFCSEYGLSIYDSGLLVDDKETADFFEEVVLKRDPKLVANIVLGDFYGFLNKLGQNINNSRVSSKSLGELIDLISNKIISGRISKEVLEIMFQTGQSPKEIVEEKGLKQISNIDEIEKIVDTILDENIEKVNEFKNGKEKLFGFFVGQVMKKTEGKANPQLVNEILTKKLNKN
ncbi:MAG: Asp-tRNA(Asn)/Glu-tRNA(Gln) amidotransferase GatCAB subunit B [Rhodospirillaceae bacterium]|nr:Asp-tRNA(Asn)/Glu-tRNA(Gln) amidotransferase GatCAB subunit B [Rhodospirillaceae bacterium]|tara:strand:+ start:1530 stop:2984 length:1455 start_codon:yes stop_codon:yes gene_type:complete